MTQSEPKIGIENKDQKAWEVTDFKIISETWDKHKLSDGSVLKARVILSSVMLQTSLIEIEAKIKAGEKPKLGLSFRAKNIFEIESPPDLRGMPDTKQYSPEELKQSIIKNDMDFTSEQGWNTYEIENGIVLKLRISIVSVNKSSKFDDRGMPVYFIESNIELKTELPDRLKKFSKNTETISPELTLRPTT